MQKYVYLIPVLPFIAFTINILLGRFVKKAAGLISVSASIASCSIALPIIYRVTQGQLFQASFDWLRVGTQTLRFGYYIDPYASVLLFVVTVIGTLIQIYAIGYMDHEPRFSRFFAYISLFMAGMLTLVIANNLLLFFMAWEIMGLCSYLLIGFYMEKDSAANASRKAFLTTRVGDVLFFIGILLLFTITGTLQFYELPAAAAKAHPLLPIAALFIFCGTIGKSAQVPLHVWLPDAMEGPTPVSALIHAATMVAAGVYLLSRTVSVFTAIPAAALPIVMEVGTITAFMAAFIALTATDIKKVLAYSTISQLGFMVAAFGLGQPVASTFHLMTHAFFKALLFLGAGSVIHGTGTQDLRKMGGLFGSMKHTATTFLIAALAIAGVPPFSGFWSKDEILLAAYDSHHPLVFWILTLTAFMTAFYMFRLVFMAFFGKARDHHIHAHESPASMTLPLWVLAIGSLLVGLPGSPFMHHWFQNFLERAPHAHAEEHLINGFVVACSIGAGLGGIALAYYMYLKNPEAAGNMATRFKPLYQLSMGKFYFDELYADWVVKPFHALGRALFGFDQTVVDGTVNQTGIKTMSLSAVKQWIDKYIVDGLVNFVGYFTQWTSSVVRRFQTGFVQHYILVLVTGTLALIFLNLK
ncbi:MAG: NADH-quinone oxidoreductase subunit L [Candidatus Omnitrophica bacterium]|nr:NADH-quinone oxidoreductase subunit L [Candidatus Omnitrophota bacterium]